MESTGAMSAFAFDPPIFGTVPVGIICRKRRAAYAVIAREYGRIAAVHGPGGYWLPGGGACPGEAPEDAVVREVREELGRGVRLTGKVGEAVQYFHSSADECWYEMTAVFFLAEFEGEPRGAGEHELCWLNPCRASELFFHACHAWAVTQACREHSRTIAPPDRGGRVL